MYITLFIFVTLSNKLLNIFNWDLIKEISTTFSKKTQRNFIKFFSRKRPSSFRKDVKLLKNLTITTNQTVIKN